jgi:hypothetical protein
MQSDAAIRAANALLHNNGGRTVLLRMPAPATPGSAAEELGLATPTFQDVELAPAVFRKDESTAMLLVSATAVADVLGSLAFDAADTLFRVAQGIVVDDVVFAIKGCVSSQADGAVYCYNLMLEAPVW